MICNNPTQFPSQYTVASGGWTSAGGIIYKGYGNSSTDFYYPATGVMTRGGNGQTKMTDILDGASNTSLFVESAGRPFAYGLNNQLNTNQAGGNIIPGEGRWADPNGECKIKGSNPNTVANSLYPNGTNKTAPLLTGIPGCTQPFGLHDAVNVLLFPGGTGVDLNTASMNCNNINEPYSFHGTGCNFAFADGSVHFLANNTPVYLLGQLATKAGSEPFLQGSIP